MAFKKISILACQLPGHMTPGRVLTDADLNFHTCLQEGVAWGPLKVKGRYARPAGMWTPRGAQPPGGRRDSIFRVKALELEV